MNFLINVATLTIISIIVKVLGLVNKMALTRIVGIDALGLITLSLPTINLFITLSQFSLTLSISKRISEGRKNNRSLIIKSVILSTIISTILSIILVLFSGSIAKHLLKQELLKYPILASIPFIYFTGYSGILKGYFHGHNMVKINAYSNIYEQLFRILISVTLAYYFSYNIVLASVMIVLTNGIAEVISTIYLLFKARKITKLNFKIEKKKELDEILNISIPSTLSRIIQAIVIFLEPICFTYALESVGLENSRIVFLYTIFHSFSMPLLTLFAPISSSIQTSLYPVISRGDDVNYNVSKSVKLVTVPGIIITLALYFYGSDLIYVLFGSDEGGLYVKNMSIFYFLSYFTSIYITALQGMNKIQFVLKFTTIISVFELILIILSAKFNPIFCICLSFNIGMILNFIVSLSTLIKCSNYRINKKGLIQMLITFLLAFIILPFINNFIIGIIVIILIVSIMYHKSYINFKEISKEV